MNAEDASPTQPPVGSDFVLRSHLTAAVDCFNAFLQTEVAPYITRRAVVQLADPMLYALDAPGKRIRPFLVMLAAGFPLQKSGKSLEATSASSGSDTAYDRAFYETNPRLLSILWVATAVECIHTYSLIHDDLPAMDNDDLRRGRPTCHIQFGDWAAILAGDALNTLAFELLARAHHEWPDLPLSRVLLSLSQGAGISGMVCGQALDLFQERNPISAAERSALLDGIHLRKTAALIRAACELGALCAGHEDVSAFGGYGNDLGLAFQIADDLLDVRGDASVVGKTVQSDAGRGKLTYPSHYGIEASETRAYDLQTRLENLAQQLLPGPLGGPDYRAVWNALPAYVIRRTS